MSLCKGIWLCCAKERSAFQVCIEFVLSIHACMYLRVRVCVCVCVRACVYTGMCLIQPGRAIDAYQKAIKKDPHNGQMASKAGKAMIHTHNYNRVRCKAYAV